MALINRWFDAPYGRGRARALSNEFPVYWEVKKCGAHLPSRGYDVFWRPQLRLWIEHRVIPRCKVGRGGKLFQHAHRGARSVVEARDKTGRVFARHTDRGQHFRPAAKVDVGR